MFGPRQEGGVTARHGTWEAELLSQARQRSRMISHALSVAALSGSPGKIAEPAPRRTGARGLRRQYRPRRTHRFRPVSAETQPVSGRVPIQISDIEKFEQRLATFGRNSPKFLEKRTTALRLDGMAP